MSKIKPLTYKSAVEHMTYVRSLITLEEYNRPNTATNLLAVFREEYAHMKSRYATEKELFIQWAKGAPNSLDVEYYYSDIRKAMLELKAIEYKDDDEVIERQYLGMIYECLVAMAMYEGIVATA